MRVEKKSGKVKIIASKPNAQVEKLKNEVAKIKANKKPVSQ